MSPIDCEQVLREIELYLDGELHDDVEMGEIREHLSRCGPCMDRSEFRKHVRELLAAKCGCNEVPEHLLERVQALLRDPGPA